MKVALLSVPGLSPYSPPLGLLSLAAYLTKNGVAVTVIDVSIEYLHYQLNPDRLAGCFRVSAEAARRVSTSADTGNDPSFRDRVARVAEQQERILERLRAAWGPTGFLLKRTAGDFCEVIDAVSDTLFFLSLPFRSPSVSSHPNDFSLNRPWVCGSFFSRPRDPFAEYCESVLIPMLRRAAPDLVGVSFSYAIQVKNGLRMIGEIARNLKVPVVVGGSFFYYLATAGTNQAADGNSEVLRRMAPFLEPFGVLGEGEKPLLQLCGRIENGHATTDVPGLVWRRGEQVCFSRPSVPVDTRELPPIELDQVPIGHKYLSPIRMAPLLTSRGCYWSRCSFCDHAAVIGSQWREMDPERVFRNLETYSQEYGIEFVLFCDESTSPRMLKRLSELISSNKIAILFGGMARFEKKLLALIDPLSAAGCKFLAFGLESGCQRIVDLMNKGFLVRDAEEVLVMCKQHNIAVQLFTIFGFPTEKLSEAAETISFMERNQDRFETFRAVPWVFKDSSPIARNPQSFGLEALLAASTDPGSRFRLREGISQELAAAVIRELGRNDALQGKMISHAQEELRQEEYHITRRLCGG